MKLSLIILIALGIIAAAVHASAQEDNGAGATQSLLSRSKRGIGDFFRRLVGGRRKNNTPQQAQPFAPASNVYPSSAGQEYLYGQASNLLPMYHNQMTNPSEYVFPGISSSQSGAFAYGHYGSPNGNAQSGNQGGHQQQYGYYGGNQQGQEGYQPQGGYQQSGEQAQYHQGGYPQQGYMGYQQQHPGQFQSDESANAAVSYETPQQQHPDQRPNGHSAGSVAADQDGISYSQPNEQQHQFAPHMMAQSQNAPYYASAQPQYAASHMRPQYAPYGDRNQFSAKPYGSNPGTIDVHQVLDQFIRSAGLSPQGDHESAKGDQHYAESNLKPVLSVKKLVSYPFYFSSSGDKPTSYGQSIRRQSNDETIFNTALKQNLLASQKMDQPSEPVKQQKQQFSQPGPSPVDEESQFIAKHAHALQEFLSKPSSSTQQSNNHYYYNPSSDAAKDNKVTTSHKDTSA